MTYSFSLGAFKIAQHIAGLVMKEGTHRVYWVRPDGNRVVEIRVQKDRKSRSSPPSRVVVVYDDIPGPKP